MGWRFERVVLGVIVFLIGCFQQFSSDTILGHIVAFVLSVVGLQIISGRHKGCAFCVVRRIIFKKEKKNYGWMGE